MARGDQTSEFKIAIALISLLVGVLCFAIWKQDFGLAAVAIAGKVLITAAYSFCRSLVKILDPATLLSRWVGRLIYHSIRGSPMPPTTDLPNVASVPSDANFVAGLVEKTDTHAKTLLANAVAAATLYGIYKLAKLIGSKSPTFAAILNTIEQTAEAQVNPPAPPAAA